MLENLPMTLATLALVGLSARALAACRRNRRNPAPALDQVLDGLGWGIAIGCGIFALAILASP